MDRVEQYREIVRRVLSPYTTHRYSNADVENKAVFDQNNDHYLIMQVGWQKGKPGRIHGCLLHLDIINGKVWIQRDGTEYGIAYELEEAGIPKSDIVPGFHPPEDRPYTGYAVA